MSKEIIRDIRLLINGDRVNSEETNVFLYKHGCYYLLEKATNRDMQLRMKLLLNQEIVLSRYKACADLFKELSNIPYAVIKGAVLSKEIYGSVMYRFSGDIDILVSCDNLDKVKKILIKQGFVQGQVNSDKISMYTRQECIFQKAHSHQLASFVKETEYRRCPFVAIDVNYDVFWGEKKEQTNMNAFLSNLKKDVIAGVEIRKLAPEEEFISLCLHHYKDMNSLYLLYKGNLKLSLLCDIYYYLENCSLDMDLLLKKCNEFGATEYVYYCIHYTAQVFGLPDLKKRFSQFCSEKAILLLDRFGLTEEERKMWRETFEDRLLSKDFSKRLETYLTDEDYKKIKINEQYL